MDSSRDKSISTYNENSESCHTDCDGLVDTSQQFIVVNIIVRGSFLTIYFFNIFIVFILFYNFFVNERHRIKGTRAHTNS